MLNRMLIYEGFADGLSALNHTVASDLMARTSLGRAYRTEDGIHDDVVQVQTIAEEEWHHRSLQLAFRKASPGKAQLYAGVAGFINLCNIAVMRPAAALLFDINVVQTRFWQQVIDALAVHERLADFKKAIVRLQKTLPREVRQALTKDGYKASIRNYWTPDRIFRTLTAKDLPDWLDSAEDSAGPADLFWLDREYAVLHQMAKRRAIGALTLDVGDTEACDQLSQFLAEVRYVPRQAMWQEFHSGKQSVQFNNSRMASLQPVFDEVARRPDISLPPLNRARRGIAVDTLYVSNVFTFIGNRIDWALERGGLPGDAKGARKNLEMFLTPAPAIIHDRPAGGNSLGWPRYCEEVHYAL